MSRTLLQLKRSWEKDSQNLVERPTAYFWGWLGTKFSKVLVNRAIGQGETLKIEQILNRFNKVFNADFVYVGDSYHFTSSRLLLWPKKKSLQILGLTRSLWVSSIDGERLKSCGVIRWCNERKLWALDSLFMNYFTKDTTGKIITKQGAYRVDERSTKFFACPTCSMYWTLRNREIVDDIIYCPICATKHKQPNKPHNKNDIYQGYHCSSRNGWEYKIQRLKDEDSMPMGVELEVDIRNPGPDNTQNKVAWEIYQEQLALNNKWHNLIFERDGSLGAHGMEIISHPMTLEYGSVFWRSMIPIIAKRCTGWETPITNDYGIHITVPRKYWTDLQIAKAHKFLTAVENTSFIVSIAQRGVIYGGKTIGTISQKLRDHYTFKSKGKLGIAANRYCLMNVKDRLIEFRMFQSTLNKESFLKNLEFIDALRLWISDSAQKLSYMEFLKWIVSSKANSVRYSNLLSYLNRKQFHVKKVKFPILNTWKDFISDLTEEQNITQEETL